MSKYRFTPGHPTSKEFDDYDPEETMSEYEHDVLTEHGLFNNSGAIDPDSDWREEYEEWLRSQQEDQ